MTQWTFYQSIKGKQKIDNFPKKCHFHVSAWQSLPCIYIDALTGVSQNHMASSRTIKYFKESWPFLNEECPTFLNIGTFDVVNQILRGGPVAKVRLGLWITKALSPNIKKHFWKGPYVVVRPLSLYFTVNESSDMSKWCPTRKKKQPSSFYFYFFLRHAKKKWIFFTFVGI